MAGTQVELELLIRAVSKNTGDIQRVASALNKISLNAQKASNAIKVLEQNALKLIAAGTAISAIAFFPIKTAASFQKSMSRVRAVTEGANAQFAELNKTASDLGGRTEFTAKQVADGMTFLGLAGFNASEVIQVMNDTVDLAAAGQIDLAAAADISTNILKGFNLEVDQTSRVLDVMATTATNSNTNITQLGQAMKFAAPVARAAGVEIEQAAAAIGVLSNNGIQATLAGTGMRIILASLLSPAKKARDALSRLNVEIAFNEDGSLNLIETLKRLRAANLSAADAFAIFQRRGASSALALVSQVDEVEALTEKNENAKGSLTEMAAIMRDNLEFATVRLTSALDRLARSFGAPLLDPLRKAALFLADLSDSIAAFVEENETLASVIISTVAILGLIVTALGAFGLAIGGAVAIFAAVSAALTTASLTFAGVLATLLGFVAPVAAVIGIIGALVGAVVLWNKSSDDTTKAIKQTNSEIKQLDKDAQATTKTFNKLSNSLQSAQDELDNTTVGTEKHRKAQEELENESSKLVKQLEIVIAGNSSLANSAQIALASIDQLKGGLVDGGQALGDFRFDQQVDALTKFREGLKVTAQDINTFANKTLKETLKKVIDQQSGEVVIKTVVEPLDPKDTKALKSVEAQFANLLKQQEQAGLISFESSAADIKRLGEGFNITGVAVNVLIDQFVKLRDKAAIVASGIKESSDVELSKRSEIEFAILDNIKALKGLKKANDEAQKGLFDDNGVEKFKATTQEVVKAQQAEKKLADAVKATTDEFRKRDTLQLEDLRKSLAKLVQEEDDAVKKGIKSKQEAENAKQRAQANSLRQQIAVVDATLQQVKALEQAGVTDFEQFQKSKEKLVNDLTIVEKEQAITFSRINNDALKKVKTSFESTFKSIGSTIETEIGKAKKSIEKFEDEIKKINKQSIDDRKEGEEILKKARIAAGEISVSKERELSDARKKLFKELNEEVSKVQNIQALVAEGDTEKIEAIRDKLKELRTETARINKESKFEISDTKNIQNIRLTNNLIDQTNRALEKTSKDGAEKAKVKIAELEAQFKKLQEAGKIPITLQNVEETIATIIDLSTALNTIGVDVDQSKLDGLKNKISDAFKNVPGAKIGVELDEEKVAETKSVVVRVAENEFKDIQIPLELAPAFKDAFGDTIPGFQEAQEFLKQAGRDLKKAAQEAKQEIEGEPLTAKVQTQVDDLELKKQFTQALADTGSLDIELAQASIDTINKQIEKLTDKPLEFEGVIDFTKAQDEAALADGGAGTALEVKANVVVDPIALETTKASLDTELPSKRDINITPKVKPEASEQAVTELQTQFNAAGEAIQVNVGATPTPETPKTFTEALTGAVKELPVEVPVEATEESPENIKKQIQEKVNTTPLVAVKIQPDEPALQKARARIISVLGKTITVTIVEKRVAAKASGGIVNAFRTGGLALSNIVHKFANGGANFSKHVQGKIKGYGGGDKVKGLMERGEFVMKKESVRNYGENFMNAINEMRFGFGRVSRFQSGGAVSSGNTTNLNLRINGSNPVELRGANTDIKRLTKILRREGLVTT